MASLFASPEDYLASLPQAAAPPRGMVAPTPTGPTGPMGYLAAPVAGIYETGAQLGGAVQAGAKLIGANDVAQSAADFAARQRATAATYENPDVQNYAWYDPRNIAYQVLKGAPVAAGMVGAGFLTGGAADAGALGATAARLGAGKVGALTAGMLGYPLAVGSNVEAAEAVHGPLSDHDAAKAALWGVPEAVAGALPYGMTSNALAQGVKGSLLHEATRTAAAQAIAGGAQDAIAQQMNDRSIPFRMSEMMQSILTGGVTGALMGAGVHALAPSAKTPPPEVGDKQMGDMVDAALTGQRLLPPPSPTDQLGTPLQITDQSSNRLASGQVVPYFEQRPLGEEPTHAAPGVVNAPSPDDIPVRPFQHLTDQEVYQKARFLFDNGAGPGDPVLDALREEWQIRMMVADQGAQRALPAPERVAAASPDLESEPVHEPTTAQVTTGFDAKGNPVLAPAPIELGQTHVGESVVPGAPPALEPPARGLGSQEPIVPPAPEKPAVNPMDAVREAAKGITPLRGPAKDLLSDPKTTSEVLDAYLSEKLKDIDAESPIRGRTVGKDVLQLAQIRGLADPDGRKAAPPVAAPENPAVVPLQELITHPTVVADAGLAAKVGAALDTARTPQVSQEARDIASKVPETANNGGDARSQSLDTLKAMTDVAAPGLSPGAAKIVNKGWQTELAKDDTGQSAWDKYAVKDKLSPAAYAALEAHGNVVEDAKALPGPRAITPQTQVGVDMEHITDNGGSLKDNLAYLQRNGSSGSAKTIANMLLRHGVDAQMRVSGDGLVPEASARFRVGANSIDVRPGEMSERVVLHEGIHAATAKAIEAGGPAAKDMQQLYDTMKARSPGNDAYGMKNVHEFVAEAFTNDDFNQFLDSHKADPSLPEQPKTLWQAFKNVVAKILGARQGAERTMLDQVLETGNRLMDENKTAPASQGGTLYSKSTPQGANETAKDTVAKVASIGKAISDRYAELGPTMRNVANYWSGEKDIARAISKTVPGATDLVTSRDAKENQQNAWNKHGAGVIHAAEAQPAEQKALINSSMNATILKIRPDLPWKEQPNKELFTSPQREELKAESDKAYRNWGRMTPEAQAVYRSLDVMNQGRLIATKLNLFDSAMKTKFPELTEGFETNPGTRAQLDAAGHDDPAIMKANRLADLNQRIAGAEKFVTAAESTGKAKDAEKVAPIKRWLTDLKTMKDGLDNDAPYFRAGRGRGSFFVSGEIKPNKTMDGPDAAAVAKIGAKLKALGHENLVIQTGNDNRQMFARVETAARADELHQAFRELQAADALTDKKTASGPISEGGHYGVGPAVLQDIVEALRAARPNIPDGVSKEEASRLTAAWDASMNDAISDIMDMTPASATSKIFATRENVQLHSGDMIENAKQSVANTSRMLATLGTAHDQGAAMSRVREDLRAVNESSLPNNEKLAAHSAANELLLKQARSPVAQPSGPVSVIQGVTSRFEIGTSLPYTTALLSQGFTWSLPALGSTHGMWNAAKALGSETLPSFAVMKAMLKAGGPEALSAGVRLKTLLDGGIPRAKAEFLTRMDNKGALMQNAYSHQMAPFEEGGGLISKIANWTSVLQRYAEAYPRIQLALAARRLWREGKDGALDDFVLKKMQAQQNWGTTSTPRALSAGGTFGPAGPLLNTFMGYRVRVTSYLFHQVHELIAGETGADKLAAGKFLLAHLGATTVLAGAMGLPMVAVFASVYDKIADTLTGSPTHDIMGSFRQYLNHVYGPAVGQAIARGAPTLLGVDMSRLGEQKLLPGSDMAILLTEKRKFEDAQKDWLKNMAGPSVGMAGEWLLGMRDISNGDYLNGAIKMAPEGLRGPVEALRDQLYGYRNKGGTPLGITPSGIDIALTAMGFDPEQKATNDLNKSVLTGLQTRRQIQSQNITQELAKAVQTHNPEAFRYWEGQSAQAQQDWPGFAPPIAHLQRYLATQAQQAGVARSLGAPLGIRQNDVTARSFFGGGGMLQGR